ncbi:hypothetical protein ACFQRL_01380 [Microbacterium fluvii]|uniref:DUF559 domain-containing protein n=1 Tax=Microbacterium fluvii TaxID=415215 RepID=A0ABW2HCV9_9MICO|nr:hypothetical protein [Microbacterium fluvii]MCU4671239.1 hypothetical protein [Microbacterium fluvii]
MPVPPIPLPAALGGEFTSAAARALGVTGSRLAAKDLEQPFHGVRRVKKEESPSEDAPGAHDRALRERVLRDAHTYRLVMAHHAFFIGRTAVVIHGATALGHGADLEVGVVDPRRAPRARGVRGRKLLEPFARVTSAQSLPVLDAAAAWAALGSDCDVLDLIRLGDELVRIPRGERGRPEPARQITTIAQLREAISLGVRPGTGRLLTAIDHVRVGSMSVLETEYRIHSCAAGMPEPDLDVEIRNAAGALLGIADAAYHQWRVLVEVEGDQHRVSREQWQRDIEKHAAFTAEGWEVLRLTGGHIRGRGRPGITRVAEALARRGWRRAG